MAKKKRKNRHLDTVEKTFQKISTFWRNRQEILVKEFNVREYKTQKTPFLKTKYLAKLTFKFLVKLKASEWVVVFATFMTASLYIFDKTRNSFFILATGFFSFAMVMAFGKDTYNNRRLKEYKK